MGQGGPVSGGTNLGTARGSIVIDVSNVENARRLVKKFAADLGHDFDVVDKSTRQAEARLQQFAASAAKAQQPLAALGGSLRSLAASIGAGLGASEFIEATLAAEDLATAYRRQSVAARNLAGSQSQLNRLLEVYDQATGGVIDKAQSLSDVTRLMAVGFADSAAELDQFVRAVRGISLATGRQQDFVVTQLQMEMLNQTGLRLDQLGLGMEEVRQKADALRAANSQLTEQQAYQQAVLTTAQAKFGALSRSAEAQATEVEKLRKTWADLRLEMGQNNTSAVNAFAKAANQQLNDVREIVQGLIRDIINAGIALRGLNDDSSGIGVGGIQDQESFWTADPIGDFADKADRAFSDWLARLSGQLTSTQRLVLQGSRERDAGRHPRRGGAPIVDAPDLTERNAAITQWARDVAQIERQAANDRIDAVRQFEQQRANTIREYGQTIAREAYDFGVQRLRAEQDHAKAIADVRQDAAARELRMAEDLARTIGRARSDSAERLADMQENLDRTINQRRADSAERIAEWEADRDKTIAERREDSNKRLVEIEGEFARERERAQRDHNLRLNEAAAALDARAIFFEKARFKQESEDRLAARDEEVRSEKEKLDEAIAQLNKAHTERLNDEKRALDKSIDQAKEAYQRQADDEKEALEQRIADANAAYQQQLKDARAADAERLADMEADFALRKTREDADRATRLQRLATDHNEQLAEQARAHGDRLDQISRQAGEERARLDEEFLEQLDQFGVHNEEWLEKQRLHEAAALTLFDKWWEEINKRLGAEIGPMPENPFLWKPGEPPRINPTPTPQPGVNPDGGAAPVQPSPIPYASMLRFNYPTPVATSAATGTGGRGLNIGALQTTIVLGDIGNRSDSSIRTLIETTMLDMVKKATGAYPS